MSLFSSKISLVPIVLLSLTIFSGLIASRPRTSANTYPVDDEITITVDSACAMGQTVLSSSNTLNPGETATIGSSRIAAYCNDSDGYAVYAIGYTDGEYGNTNLTNIDNDRTIQTGTSDTTGSNSSYWNMKLTPGVSIAPLSYIPDIESPFLDHTAIPDDYTLVASFSSTTIPQLNNPLESGSYFTVTYETHLSTNQPAGVYNGEVQYVIVHPQGASVPTKTNIDQLVYMQDFSKLTPIQKKWVKDSMLVGAQYQLKDSRDSKTYYISKLADGNIWMTQNLDLEIDSAKTYTSEDTDVESTWSPVRSTVTSINAWEKDYYTPQSLDPGDIYYYTSGSEDNDKKYLSLASCAEDHDNDNCAHYHAGNYYNWAAAVASNDTSSLPEYTNTSNSICPSGWRLPQIIDGTNDFFGLIVAQGGIAGEDLNWTSGYYWAENGMNNIRTNPLWFARAGYITNNYDGYAIRLVMDAADGRYWLGANARDDHGQYPWFHNAYSFSFRSSYILGGTGDARTGMSIRCIAR